MSLRENYSKKQIMISVVVIVVLVVGFIGLLFIGGPLSKNARIKRAISQKIHQSDFKVNKVIIEDNGWELAEISNKSGENLALAILHNENGGLVVRFGPGTSFDRKAMLDASVPDSIISKVIGGPSADPIMSYLPHSTKFYKVTYGGNSTVQGKDITTLYVYIYEVPRLGIYATEDSFDKYKLDINKWLTSIDRNPNDYLLVLSNGNTGVSGD